MKNESDVVFVSIVENDMPVLVVREEREGFVSTITEYFIIYGKEKLGPFDDAEYIWFFEGKLYYKAKIDWKWYLFIGKEKIGPFDDVDFPEFSHDGKILYYRAKIDGKLYIFVGKEKIGPFDDVYVLKFSPDGKILVYRAQIDGKWYYKVFFDSKVYTGSVCRSKFVYIKDGKIMLRE